MSTGARGVGPDQQILHGGVAEAEFDGGEETKAPTDSTADEQPGEP